VPNRKRKLLRENAAMFLLGQKEGCLIDACGLLMILQRLKKPTTGGSSQKPTLIGNRHGNIG
jgi:hypothetical protein